MSKANQQSSRPLRLARPRRKLPSQRPRTLARLDAILEELQLLAGCSDSKKAKARKLIIAQLDVWAREDAKGGAQ